MSYYDRRHNPNHRHPSPWDGSRHARMMHAEEAAEQLEKAPSKQELVARISVVNTRETLRDWDRNFLQSIGEQLERRGSLSPKQVEILAKIEERNSPEVIEGRKVWQETYNDEKRNIAKICASYYATTDYFTDLSEKILSNDEFVPSEKQYKALCENKYAKKVLKATFVESKFNVGDSVSLRATAPWDARTKMGDNGRNSGVIISVGAKPVISAANGAKNYQILPFGSFVPVVVEERYIKKMKMPKKVS